MQHIRQGVAVITAGVLPGAGAQLILSTLNGRRVGSLGDGAQIVINGSGNLVGVGHADFKGFFLREIAELLQHIRRGAVEQRGLVVSILKAVACLQDRAVNAVLRLLEVNVTGGNHGDMQFFAQLMMVRLKFLMASMESTCPLRTMNSLLPRGCTSR